MKYVIIAAIFLSASAWIACGHGRPAETSETTTTTPLITPPGNTDAPTQSVPVTLDGNNTATTPLSITPSGTTTAGLNPEHGQPGHRCDIAVGAPLNSAPAKPSTPTITNTPAISAPTTSPLNIATDKPAQPSTTTKTAPGMNPPHGEPGHRCDIAVGEPLSSKPAATTTPEIKATTTPEIKTTTPAMQPAATTKTAPGMNPPHGEPGHRCDIGVGEPLSTPAKPNYTAPADNKSSIPSVVPVKPAPIIKKDGN